MICIGKFVGSDLIEYEVAILRDEFEKIQFLLDTSNTENCSPDLSFRFNNKQLFVDPPTCYANGNACGLLGKFNNNPLDDLEMSNGKLAQHSWSNDFEFGNSWWIYNNDESKDIVESGCNQQKKLTKEVCGNDFKLLDSVRKQCRKLHFNEFKWCCDLKEGNCGLHYENCITDACACMSEENSNLEECMSLPSTTVEEACNEPAVTRRRRRLGERNIEPERPFCHKKTAYN